MKIGLEKYQQRQSSTLVDYYIFKDLFPKELFVGSTENAFLRRKKF